MKNLKHYDPAEIELIYLENHDIITTSGEPGGEDEETTPPYDKGGWT